MSKNLEFDFGRFNVAIVENEPASLRGLMLTLEQIGCVLAWTAKNDHEAMEHIRTDVPDVVFVDLKLLRGSDDYEPGWQLIQHLRQRGEGRNFAIVICSGTPVVDKIVLEAIRLGCSYVVKEDLWGHEQAVIAGALLAARSGSVFLSNEVASGLEILVTRTTEPQLLSPKELEVLSLIASGYSNDEIARRLVVTVATVKTHVSNILSKLSVDNRGKAAEWYRQNYG
jgi:DNA-binding NarL/FixJ family response regulator